MRHIYGCISERRILRLLAGFIALSFLTGVAKADILHLMNGSRLEGVVTRLENGSYRIKTKAGSAVLPKERIRYWDKRALPETEYAERKAKVEEDDFDGQMELGRWCRERRLLKEAKWHFTLAVALNPDNAKAQVGAGFVRKGDRWITVKKSMEEKGYQLYGKKWLPTGEAIQKRMEDEREKEYEANHQAAWTLFRKTACERTKESLEERAEIIAALGPDCIDATVRASSDGFTRVRLLAILTAGRYECAKSLDILLRRLEVEPDPAVFRKLISGFVRRRDRMQVLTKTMDLMINSQHRGIRKRCWRVIDALGDPRAITTLVPMVEQKMNKVETDSEEKEGGESREVVSSGSLEKKAYRPAHDALVFLTGEMLPPKAEAWRMWWGVKQKTFQFRGKQELEPFPVPGSSPVAVTQRSEP